MTFLFIITDEERTKYFLLIVSKKKEISNNDKHRRKRKTASLIDESYFCLNSWCYTYTLMSSSSSSLFNQNNPYCLSALHSDSQTKTNHPIINIIEEENLLSSESLIWCSRFFLSFSSKHFIVLNWSVTYWDSPWVWCERETIHIKDIGNIRSI